MMMQKGDPCVKMFSTLSGVRLMFYVYHT